MSQKILLHVLDRGIMNIMVIIIVMVSMAHTQTCYSGNKTRGTPEELISAYFVRERTRQHVHPMANSPFELSPQVSHKL